MSNSSPQPSPSSNQTFQQEGSCYTHSRRQVWCWPQTCSSRHLPSDITMTFRLNDWSPLELKNSSFAKEQVILSKTTWFWSQTHVGPNSLSTPVPQTCLQPGPPRFSQNQRSPSRLPTKKLILNQIEFLTTSSSVLPDFNHFHSDKLFKKIFILYMGKGNF